jgi:hypothetical protein
MQIKSIFIRFDKLLGETPRAYLILIRNKEVWFPSRFCRNFILNKKLGGNMVIPAWLYKEKLGQEPDECDAVEFTEYHKPEKKKKLNNNIIKELKK